ncbi:hypothetical protein JCM8097_003207, partial [Rhodosporidiobolus ruineniae]
LKDVLDYSLLRVFEGLGVALNRGRSGSRNPNVRPGQRGPARAYEQGRGRQFENDDEDEAEADEEAVDYSDPTLSEREVKDLDRLTSNVVHLLNSYNASLGPASSRTSSRPQTPSLGPPPSTSAYSAGPSSLGMGAQSRNSTPYSSRPPSSMGGNVYQQGGGGASYHQGGGGNVYQQGGGGATYHQGGGGGFGGGTSGGGASGSGNWRRR